MLAGVRRMPGDNAMRFGWRVMWVAVLVVLLASGCAWVLQRQQLSGGRYGDV